MEDKPNYYAIIPANVRYDHDLKDKAKLLYGEIVSLTSKTGECWATNNYFSELYEISLETTSRLIGDLEKKGYIKRKIFYKNGTKEIEKRVIYPIDQMVNTSRQNGQYPPLKKVKGNNTSINNKKIYNKLYIKEFFKKPKIEEIKKYCDERQNKINPNNFYDFYESKNWMVGKNKMKDWKACIRTWEQRQQPNINKPAWFDNKITSEKATESEQAEIASMLDNIK